MRLLVTRAAAEAERTRRKLEAMGHEVIISPVIEVAPTDAAWPEGVVDALLATSAQAFQAQSARPLPEARRLLPLFLVGERTAEAARREGYFGAAIVAQNAADLAAAIGQSTFFPRRTVYLAGRDRKPTLETAFVALGLDLEVVEVYAARASEGLSDEACRAIRQGAVEGVLHYSRRSAALFIDAMTKNHLDLTHLSHACLSEDAATPLREAGCAAIRVAETPVEADLLALAGRHRNEP